MNQTKPNPMFYWIVKNYRLIDLFCHDLVFSVFLRVVFKQSLYI